METFQNVLLSSISTTRQRSNQGKCILAHNSHLLYPRSKPLYPRVHWIVLNLVKTAMPISANHFFPQICKMSQTYFFKLLPGDFTYLHQTFYTASVDSPDRKLLKLLVFQTILKLLNNNFLYILLNTQNVAYVHIGVSK